MANRVWVKGYTRYGKKVAGHWRTVGSGVKASSDSMARSYTDLSRKQQRHLANRMRLESNATMFPKLKEKRTPAGYSASLPLANSMRTRNIKKMLKNKGGT